MEEIRKGLKRDWRCKGAAKAAKQVGDPIQVELKSNLDSRNSPHQNHRPDHIPTPFLAFFIWIER
jgi:hypothetical protein